MNEDHFDIALNKAIDLIGAGSKNKFCGEMDITQSHFYRMVNEKRMTPGVAVRVERITGGEVLAMHLCPEPRIS